VNSASDGKIQAFQFGDHYLQCTADCITALNVTGRTGTRHYAGFGARVVHHIVLKLDGEELRGDLKGPVKRGESFGDVLSLSQDFKAGARCIKRSDIRQVRLVAGDKNGWRIVNIRTRIVKENGEKEVLTNNRNFNRWLETDKKNRRSYVLNIED
jgi:hypothetical protein